MKEQKNILLMTNSTTESELNLIKEAFAQAKANNIPMKLTLVHVIPNLPACYFNIPSMAVLAERYYEEATQTLSVIGEKLGVSKRDQWLMTGKMKTEVLRLASKLNTDYILASSSSLQDLHESFQFLKRQKQTSPFRSINSLVSL